jgi:hypothetical protein
MEHYQAQGDLANLPSESLERRARILHAMGEDEERRGRLADASVKFAEAHRTTAALLSQQPQNADRIFAHAQSEYWVGYAAWRGTDIERAGQFWRGYLKHAQHLGRVEPKTVRSYMELGYAHGNMCELLVNKRRDVRRGIHHCRKSIMFEREALKLDPDNAANGMALANRLGWMADALVAAGDLDQAIQYRKAEQSVVDRLSSADPLNAELRIRQTWPQIGIGKIELNRGNVKRASSILKQTLVRTEALAQQFPDDLLIREAEVRVNLVLAKTERSANDPNWTARRNRAAALIGQTELSHGNSTTMRMTTMLDKFNREER